MIFFLLVIALTKPCPYDGESARFFAERDRDGRHECGYSHEHYDAARGRHSLHLFWTDCD